jgi:hypothetical protein
MGSMVASPRVEYKYVTRPKFDGRWSETFKKILSTQAADGWEYVGTIPDVPGEMIFKRTPVRGSDPFGGMGMGMSPPMPGMGGPGGYGPMAPGMMRPGGASPFPTPGGPGAPPGISAPGLGGPSGPPGLPPGATGPAGPPPPPGVRPGSTEGGPPPADVESDGPGGAGPGPKSPTLIELTTGETIRHRMQTGAEIDRIKVIKGGTKVADVTLDPVNAKRVVIAATGRGGDMTVELTDANGAKETYTIRVR